MSLERAASARAAFPRRRVGLPLAALAARLLRSRSRRSGRACRAFGRGAAAARPSRGGTRTSRSPAANSVCSTAPLTGRQSPTAQRRSSASDRAHPSTPTPIGPLQPPRSRPSSSTAAPLNHCLCTPSPTTIILIASHRRGRPASGQTSIEAAAKLPSGHARQPPRRRRRHNTGKSATSRHSEIESAAAFPSLSPQPDNTRPR